MSGGVSAGTIASAAAAAGTTALVSGALSGGGGQSGTTQTTVNNDPWWGQQPYLQDLYAKAYSQANQPQSPQSQAAMNANYVRAAQLAQNNPLTQSALGEAQKTIGGDYLSADSNPYLKGAVQEALGAATRGVNQQFSGSNYGSSANQEWLGRSLAGTALPIYAQNYQTERGRQLATAQGAPQLSAGANYGDLAQYQASADAYTNFPWQQYGRYASLLSGNPGGTQTMTSPIYSNPLATAAGGGILGAGLLGNLFGGGSSFDPSSSYNAAGAFQPFYNGMGAGGYQYG